MKRIIVLMFLFVFTLSFSSAYAKVKGDTITTEIEFSEPKLSPSGVLPGYDHIEVEGVLSLGNVGEPVLPIKGLKILIPPDTKVKDVEVILGEKVTLPGHYRIEPGQKEYPLSQIDKIKIVPDQPKKEIYQSENPYPADVKKLLSHQKKMGYSIAILNLHPVEYIPAKGEISFYKNMSVLIRFQEDKEPKPKDEPGLRKDKGVKEKDQEEIQMLIDNPEDLPLYTLALSEPISTNTSTTTTTSTTSLSTLSLGPIPTGQYSYVIITRSDFASAFEALKQRRIQKGLTSTIVTTDWIYASYPGTRPDGGTDNKTKIRNFIKDAYNNWGTQYVLLAGDGDGANLGGESQGPIIPARGLSVFHPYYYDSNIPADLYYACLNGTFDNNANGLYGEATDGVNGQEVDLLAEVYIGRACVDSVQEATNFVNKTLAYEDSTDSYINNTYMLGEYLGFGGPSEYATDSMEEIRLGTNAHGYTTQGFLSNPDRALDPETLYDSPGYSWPKSDLINIINNGIHILNHLGHANNTYDMKLNNSDVDAFTNSKYFIAYSQGCYPGAFDNRDSSKTYITSDSLAEHLTTNPKGAVAFIGNSRYGWGMQNSTKGSSQYYNRQFWDALFNEGITKLGRMNQDSKEDNIPYLTYGMNRWCYFELNLFGDPALSVKLPNPLPLILRSDYSFLESLGNKDGLINRGETIELTVSLKAFNQDAFNVSATLSSQDSYVTIEKSNSSYGIILKGQSISNSVSPFRFKVSENCPLPRDIKFTLTITATGYAKAKNFSTKIFDPPPTTPIVSDEGGYIGNIASALLGDLNHDKQITGDDVLICLMQANGLNPATGLADINKDGMVDIIDLGLIDRMAQGLDSLQTIKITTLNASWTSSDPESGIDEYQVALGTSKGATNIYNWRTTGTLNSINLPDTVISIGPIYYFSVKAKNGTGLWSQVGYSDGITVDTDKPVITNKTITPQKVNQPLVYQAQASDPATGIKQVTLLIKQADGTFLASGALTYNATTGLYEITKPAKTAPKTITYKIKAVDNAGNTNTTVAYTLKVVN